MNGHENTVKQRFWPKLAGTFARLPFSGELVAAYYCAFDPATPLKAKGILLAALAYFILPVDVVPDFIAGLGFTDDMAVIFTAIRVISSHMRPEHRQRAQESLSRFGRSGTAA